MIVIGVMIIVFLGIIVVWKVRFLFLGMRIVLRIILCIIVIRRLVVGVVFWIRIVSGSFGIRSVLFCLKIFVVLVGIWLEIYV